MDKREQDDLDLWLTRKNDNEAELKMLLEEKSGPEYAPFLDHFEREITHTKRIIEIIDTALSLRASPNCIERRLSLLKLKTPDYLVKLKAMSHPD